MLRKEWSGLVDCSSHCFKRELHFRITVNGKEVKVKCVLFRSYRDRHLGRGERYQGRAVVSWECRAAKQPNKRTEMVAGTCIIVAQSNLTSNSTCFSEVHWLSQGQYCTKMSAHSAV